jgi:hypothetical protein
MHHCILNVNKNHMARVKYFPRHVCLDYIYRFFLLDVQPGWMVQKLPGQNPRNQKMIYVGKFGSMSSKS